MSEIKVNKISQRSGTAITLGNSGTDFQLPSGAELVAQSGSTITIAAGATITNNGSSTGFGPTGAVSWDTTPKTANFTAVSGVGYFVDTTSGVITVTLPATPSAGDIVAIKDYANTANTNNITIDRNSSNIQGIANNFTISTEGLAITLIYSDATEGWISTGAAQASNISEQALFVAATGGTVTCCGDYKIHTFTGPGTFTVSCAGNPLGSDTVDYLVVAAGGGGNNATHSGGGGAGGFRLSNSTCMPAPTTSPLASPTALPVSIQGYPITVGGGGPFNSNGSPSVFSTITSAGGGFGGNVSVGNPGGSGGGGSNGGPPGGAGPGFPGGTGNTPPVAPPQGNAGGLGFDGVVVNSNGGGAGGAGAVGGNAGPSIGGLGGIGSFVAGSGFAGCNGTPGPVPGARYFAGGGGGSACFPGAPARAGGAGGGGTGSRFPAATDGTTNTGGGGGGGGTPANGGGRSGGSGIVIIRYKYQ
jgi:hypothetical protein